MAVDMFLTLDGVKGESEDKNHPKQIGVLSWSWGMNRSGSAHVGGGPSVGKVNVQDVQVTNSWWHRRTRAKNDFFELPRREYSGLEGFCGALTVNGPAPAKAPLPGLDETMKPISTESLTCRSGTSQPGFATRALPSPAGGVSGAGRAPFTGLEWKSHRGLLLHPQPNPVVHGGLRT